MKPLAVIQIKHIPTILLALETAAAGFCDLQNTTTINTATLQKRLALLLENKLITYTPCPVDGRCGKYALSHRGKAVTKHLHAIQTL